MNARKQPRAERDPYPKMIIVLIAVTLLLFLLVAGVMVYDFAARGRSPSTVPGTALMNDEPPDSAGTPAHNGGVNAP